MSVAPCPAPTPPALGVVVFDLAAFRAQYPAFASVPDAAVNFNFTLAELMLNNSCCSVVTDANQREMLLNLLTAHITALLNGVNGQAPSGAVGRVATGTEGSITVGLEYATTTSQSMAYFTQTSWGAQFWQATVGYRTMRYIPAPQRNYGPFPFYAEPGFIGFGGPGFNGGCCG